jgi:hypothetical protein
MTSFLIHLDYRGLSKQVQEKLLVLMDERHPETDDTAVVGKRAYCMQVTTLIMQEVRSRKIPEDNPWPGVLEIAEHLAEHDPHASADEDAVALLRGLT